MDKIYAKLFGVPQILKNGEEVFFPYAKINALIYYIVINKVVSRDEMAGLLWPDENERIAKKNLRNALYQAKKCLDADFIISPKKSILMLNEDIDIESDVNLFLEEPKKNLDLYTGDFLKGFFLKEAESYEYWITNNRNSLQDKFTSQSYLKIESDIEEGNYKNIEQRINTLVQIDEFDEKNFRLLMKYYQKTGRNSKVVETYYDLSKLLHNELGVTPDAETKKIYDESIELINLTNSRKKIPDNFFYGRYKELSMIDETLDKYKNNQASKSIYIKGEAGIGKSYLTKRVLKERQNDFFVINVYCYQAEQNFVLRPFSVLAERLDQILKDEKLKEVSLWKNILASLSPKMNNNTVETNIVESGGSLNFDMLSQIFIDTIKKINSKKKLIIVFEDLQWMDKISIRLLTSVLLHTSDEALFILTARNQKNEELENLTNSASRYDKLIEINMERFDQENSKNFLERALPDHELSQEKIDKIYTESEGNPFFLSEYVNLIKSDSSIDILSQKMMDTIKSRFLYLSKEELDILNIISYFYDEADIDIISRITGQDEITIINLIEELEKRNILREVNHSDHISIVFTHSKLREYIYMVQTDAKKKIVHKKIAQILENKNPSPYVYSKLIYHFNKAGELLKTLKYKIDTLNYYLNFSHELFPILTIQEINLDNGENIYISRDRINQIFSELLEDLEKLSKTEKEEDLILVEIEFYYMRGRYLIRDGNYTEGLRDIRYVIAKATQIENRDYVLEGYKQIIFYNIQTNKPKEMIEYIELALNLAVQCNYHKEIGILLRLKGLYNIMSGNYYTAEQLLKESINTLQVTKEVANKYSINIAASYNYIGELRLISGDYQDAIEKFKEAISLSLNKNALSALSIFYINLGKAYYITDQIEEAEKEFILAYSLYGDFDSFWKRSMLDSYMALNQIKLKNYEEAKKYIYYAEKFSSTMHDPRDLGVVNFALYQIAKEAENNKELKEVFKDKLTKETLHYKEKAIEYLDEHIDVYELNILNA